jgi:putative acetyltransferase
MTFTLRQGELHAPDVAELLAFHVGQMQAHSPEDSCHVLSASGLDRSDITFLTLRENGRLVGIGALRALDERRGEIKSMRTHPDALGRGVGSTMLQAIIAKARQRGYQELLLETGRSEDFAAATHLYFKAGFRDCGPFGGYPSGPFTRFLRLAL